MRERLLAFTHRFTNHTVTVDGLRLHIPPGVLDPVLFRSGAWFARHVARRVQPRQRLLDLGCGSAVVGLLSQRAGAQVTASDLNPRAAEAARRNGISDARHGDLFATVRAERFDHVAFNPPYFPGEPSDRGFSRAFHGGPRLEVLQRFLQEVPAHLAPAGEAWMVLSGLAPEAIAMTAAAGWAEIAAERVRGERLGFWRWGPVGYLETDSA